MSTPVIPSQGLWEFLFEQPSPPFPPNQIIFDSVESRRSWTFQQLRTAAQDFGEALQAHWDWKKGDVLMVMAPNDVDVPFVIMGCHYAGGTVAPVNPALSAKELGQQLQRSRAAALVVHPDCLPVATEAAQGQRLPPERLLCLGPAHTCNVTPTVFDFITDGQTIAQRGSHYGYTRVDPAKDIAYLIYSSGTTGQPKGVMISHRNVVAAVVMQSAVDRPHIDWCKDRTLAVLPTYHIYGLICLVHLPVHLGTTTMYLEKFVLETFCRSIQECAITHAYVAPPIVLHLVKNSLVDHYDLRSLRMLTSGGAPMPTNLINELYHRRHLAVRQAYGLSETTSVSHIQRWDLWQKSAGSNGSPLPGLEARFMRGDGHQCAVMEEGELWVRGPTVFQGYANDPEQTEQCITQDGWFKTGDIGYEDDDRNLFVTDRAKDLIKFKGYQVAPAELEDLLLKHVFVVDAAVIGVDNPSLASEVPLAYIVLRPGLHANEETAQVLLDHVKERVIAYKQLRGGIIFTESIPKSPSGKILKRVLREKANSADRGQRLGAVNYTKYSLSPKL